MNPMAGLDGDTQAFVVLAFLSFVLVISFLSIRNDRVRKYLGMTLLVAWVIFAGYNLFTLA